MRSRSLIAASALLAFGAGTAAYATTPQAHQVSSTTTATTTTTTTLETLAGRPDLIVGPSTLVAIDLPSRTTAAHITVTLNGRTVTNEFAIRHNGRLEGLLAPLHAGVNHLRVTLKDGHGATLAITDYPNSGPLFAGPPAEPWACEAGATNANCDKAVQYTYWYKSSSFNPTQTPNLLPYDPKHPPSDVAMTTTQTGETVPFIVREEYGYQDRDAYRIETLWQRGKPWAPWAPQSQWNRKLLVMHGYNCQTANGVTDVPWGDSGNMLPNNGGVADTSTIALGLGFAVMSTSLLNANVDCDVARMAESLDMAKQHIVDTLGPIRYTIGIGCSGGSLTEQTIANAYPGMYQGLITQCAFPDAGSTAQQIVDYQLLQSYFGAQASSGNGQPVPGLVHSLLGHNGWTTVQEAQVEGTAVENVPLPVDSVISDYGFFHFALPNNCKQVPAKQVYDAQANPGGVRCGLTDWNINLLGPRPQAVWGPQEKRLHRGFGGVPVGNVGVQYGLGALNAGQISPAQFVDLNANIGGMNVDWNATHQRSAGDMGALDNAYRTGMINETNNLDQVPIIDLRGPNDPGLAHDSVRSFILRQRLLQQHGTYANQVIWEGPYPIVGDIYDAQRALVAMDGWVSSIQADQRRISLPTKVIADKPVGIHDQCSDGVGQKLTDNLCGQIIVPVYGTPRTVAGEPLTTLQNVCQLKPLNRSSYKATFSATQWASLRATFPSGVCDYTKPGVGSEPVVPWLTYQNASGRVVYGGTPIRKAPAPIPF